MSENKVRFCNKCVESNQRFMTSAQHNLTDNKQNSFIDFDEDGVCLACKFFERKKSFDWNSREKELENILDRHRKSDGSYDVLVPGSGGKDSIFTSFILRDKYKMNPLTCTWAPTIYTDVGKQNFDSWLKSGFANVTFTPNKKVHGLLTKLAFQNLLHPFQPFALGQYSYPFKVALEKNIKLIIYGDGESERAAKKDNIKTKDSLKENKKFYRRNYYRKENEKIYLGGLDVETLIKDYNLKLSDLVPYFPVLEKVLLESEIEVMPITKYINYNPQKNYYFAKEKTDFQVNPDGRSEGTYTKYSSLDDKLDGLHHYTWFIKTGRGRTTEDAAIEVRNEIITREDAIMLVKKYDGEFPKKYFSDCLEFMNLNEKEFVEIIDKFRSEKIWQNKNNNWILKNAVWK
jgi:N-acetyl sugar amidotransferase